MEENKSDPVKPVFGEEAAARCSVKSRDPPAALWVVSRRCMAAHRRTALSPLHCGAYRRGCSCGEGWAWEVWF